MSSSLLAGDSPPARKKRVPGTLVLNWQTPRTQAPKPVIRRPMTACTACRSAKLRCDGQQVCERCQNRGLRCTYNRNTTLAQEPHDRPPSIDLTAEANLIVEDEISSTSVNGDTEPWGEERFNQALAQFNWTFPHSGFGTTPSQDPGADGNLDLFQDPIEPLGHPTVDDGTRNNVPGQIVPAKSSLSCQCRVNLVQHVPKLESAIRELPQPQLDKMFMVTGDVIRSCQESIHCGCYKGPVDLVCIMTAFEQTAFCFDYIAKSGFVGAVNVEIGSYRVSMTDNASLKRMLVLDLVKQANELLDAVSALAQDMFVAQSQPGGRVLGRSPACLNQLNLDYVREATASFRKLFRLITNLFGEDNSRA